MAANEQVNVDLTATDKASKVIDNVGDAVDALEKDPAELEVTADTDQASRSLDDLTGEAKRLAGQKWIVDLKADMDKALADSAELEGKLKALESNDIDIDTSKAERHLGDLDRKTEGSGTNLTNTFRDLGGPLGEMTSTVGDFGEAFQTAGESAASVFGLSGSATTAMTMGLGAVGLAIGGLTFLWSKVKEAQEKANAKTQDYVKALQAANGEIDKARRAKLGESLTDADVKRLHDYHLTLDDLTALMDGKTTPALARAQDGYAKAAGALSGMTEGTAGQTSANRKIVQDFEKITGLAQGEDSALRKASDAYKARAAVLGDTSGQNRAYLTHLQDVNTQLDHTSDTVAKIPPNKHTDVTVTDNGSAEATRRGIDNATKPREVVVTLVDPSGNRYAPGYAVGGLPGTPRSAAPMTTNVTINAPRGMTADAIVAAGTRYARRNGGRLNGARR